MAVSYINVTEYQRTDTGDPATFTVNINSGCRGLLLFIGHGTSATDHAPATATVTIGGKRMGKVGTVSDAVGEPGRADAWFLGHDLPAAGNQTLSVDLASATTDDIHFVAVQLGGDTDLEVVDVKTASGDQANPSVTLSYDSRTCITAGMLYTGLATVNTDATPNGNMTSPGASSYWDIGAFGTRVDYQTTPGTSDFTFSYTSALDDVAMVAVAVSEERVSEWRRRILQLAPDGLWMLDEPTGCLTAFDRSSNCNHAPYTNAPTLDVSGPTATGLTGATFNGTSQYAQVPSGLVVSPGLGDFTLAAWFLDGTWASSSSWLIGFNGDGASLQDIEMYETSVASRLSSRIASVAANSGTRTKNDGAWHSVVLTADRDGNAKWWLDGTTDGTVDITAGSANNITGNPALFIGRRNSTGYVSASIHAVMYKRAALTQQQVQAFAGTEKGFPFRATTPRATVRR